MWHVPLQATALDIRDILRKDSEEEREKLVRKIKNNPHNQDIPIKHLSRYG
jgi:hypothetical protein